MKTLLPCLASAPSVCQNGIFFAKKRFCGKKNVGKKLSYLSIFELEFEKTILSYLKSAPSNLSNGKISQKPPKCLNLGRKLSYLSTFGLELEKTIVIFEISTLEFV